MLCSSMLVHNTRDKAEAQYKENERRFLKNEETSREMREELNAMKRHLIQREPHKGEKASSTIEDASDRTNASQLPTLLSSPNNRFVFPTIITLLIFIRRNRQLTVRRPQA